LNKIIFLFLCLFSFQSHVFAETDKVKVGIFITNLYDFNLADGSYSVEFWTWSLFKNEAFNFTENQEIKRVRKANCANFSRQKKGDFIWEQKKCTAMMLQDWDIHNFPFDQQNLHINLEDTMLDTTQIQYLADVENSKVSDDLSLDSWKIDSVTVKNNTSTYDTTYGDPVLKGESQYSGISAHIHITRTNSWATFVKLVTGLYVAFLIALMVFRIKPQDSDSRVELAVGGLFAAVGNKYIVENIVPTTNQNTMIDNLHNVTFGAILLIVMTTIHIGRIYQSGQLTRAELFDKISFWSILLGFITLNFILILKAI